MANKYLTLFVFLFLTLSSCNKTFEKAMRSNDKELIIKAAESFHERGKYRQASELLRRATPMVLGTPDAKRVLYLAAQNSFEDKNYLLSAVRFKNYAEGNRRDSLAENALFMAAKSYYLNSPAYNLDQSDTNEAVSVIQDYVNRYPNAKNVSTANSYIIELRQKLEKKAYENAKSYYKTGFYKSADVSFQAFIEDYPDSKYREDAYVYLLKSRHEVALKSVLDKKRARLIEANTAYKRLNKLYPESRYLKEATKLNEEILKELEQTK
ncbi:MAG: outer membrane protein assembly factor BamD [Flavobacteriales bacterium]